MEYDIITPRAHARARGYVIGRGVYYIFITPRAHARARGYVIGRGVYYILLLYIVIYLQGLFLSFKILTFRRPFQHRKASLRI